MTAALRFVAVGASWGGLEALGRLLGALPRTFRAPMAVVQHRGTSTPEGAMRHYLATRCPLAVVDAQDKEPVTDGTVYLAPPDYHLLVDDGFLSLSVDPPVAFSRPSVDVLFESAADCFGDGLVAVILTGANSDGAKGALAVKRAGGTVLVQDPAEAERPEMPAAAIAAGAADGVLPVAGIAARLIELDRAA